MSIGVRKGEALKDVFGRAVDVAAETGLAGNERKFGQLIAPWVRVENVKVIGK